VHALLLLAHCCWPQSHTPTHVCVGDVHAPGTAVAPLNCLCASLSPLTSQDDNSDTGIVPCISEAPRHFHDCNKHRGYRQAILASSTPWCAIVPAPEYRGCGVCHLYSGATHPSWEWTHSVCQVCWL